MPGISLDLRCIEFRSDQNVAVSAWRAFADALFISSTGVPVSFTCIVDTGAPFSVLPYSLWYNRAVAWTSLGQQLTRKGSPSPEALEWQGVNCSLGDTYLQLVDRNTSTLVGPFVVVAKFASQPQTRPQLEMTAVLGLNFLTDNNLQLVMDGTGQDLVGFLAEP